MATFWLNRSFSGGKAQSEQMFSALPPNAAVERTSDYFRFVPEPASCIAANASYSISSVARNRMAVTFSRLSARWNRFATVRNQGARSENL
jgi:hypothetical protein